MRQAIGGGWLIQLMILFILLFAGYIILTLDYNKSVQVKNEAISILEKYEGLNENSITLLNNYLANSGYKVTGPCEEKDGTYGALSLGDTELEEVSEGNTYSYCIKKYKGANTSYYYQITLFYRFNLPVLGSISHFTIKGSTANFQPKDDIAYGKTVDGSTGGIDIGGNNPDTDEPAVRYTVTFNSNGGSAVASKTVLAGGRITEPNKPTRDGYTFNGWKLNGSTYNFYTAVNSNITLVADWTPINDEPQTCQTGFRAYDGNKKWFKVTDENGREVSSVLPGRRYIVSFQTYVIGPLSKDSDRVTQYDLNRGYGCQISEVGITSSESIVRNVNTGIYNANSDIDRDFQVPFTQYDVESVLESSAYIEIPANYSGRTIRFTGVIRGLSSPVNEVLDLRVE